MAGVTITLAGIADAADCARIYGYHVLHGTATFETEPPDEADMAGRIAKVIAAGEPWLIARDDEGGALGYAYASRFRPRSAYRFSCEDSIYIRHDRRGMGVGSALLAALLEEAGQCGFRQAFAIIGGAEPASVALHARAGFVEVGRMRSIGRKNGRWLDTLYMQRPLGPGDSTGPDEEPA